MREHAFPHSPDTVSAFRPIRHFLLKEGSTVVCRSHPIMQFGALLMYFLHIVPDFFHLTCNTCSISELFLMKTHSNTRESKIKPAQGSFQCSRKRAGETSQPLFSCLPVVPRPSEEGSPASSFYEEQAAGLLLNIPFRPRNKHLVYCTPGAALIHRRDILPRMRV